MSTAVSEAASVTMLTSVTQAHNSSVRYARARTVQCNWGFCVRQLHTNRCSATIVRAHVLLYEVYARLASQGGVCVLAMANGDTCSQSTMAFFTPAGARDVMLKSHYKSIRFA
jgi:hypothetical protein